MANANPQFYDDVEQLVDLRAVWVGLRRQASLFAAVASTIFLVVVAYALFSQEKYTAETSLIIEPKNEVFAYGRDLLTRLPADPVAVDTEVELLRSRAMAMRVARRLSQDARTADIVAVAPAAAPAGNLRAGPASAAEPFASRIAALDANVANTDGEESAAPESAATAVAEAPPPTAAVDALLADLEVERVGQTSLIKIRFTSPSSQRAADIANAYAEEYIDEQIEFQFAALRQANAWIDARLLDLRAEVRNTEQEAAAYRAVQGLVESSGGASFVERRLGLLATELTEARARMTTLRARYNTIVGMVNAEAPVESIGEAMSSAVLADLRRQKTEINRKIAELQVRYGDRYPELRKAREEARELDDQIDLQLRRIVDNVRAEYEFAVAQVQMLEADLGDLQGQLADQSTAMAELEELERNVEAPKSVYEALLNRRKELNERDSLAEANARIVARAAPPDTPSKPRRKLLLGGGFALALLFGGAAAFVSEMVDTRIKNTHDIRREFGPAAPVVLVPRIQSRRLFHERQIVDVVRKYLIDEPRSTYAESMRDLRMHLKAAEKSVDGGIAIAFSSIFRDAGTTMTAFSFAVVLANSGKRVAFLDCAKGGADIIEPPAAPALQPAPVASLITSDGVEAQGADKTVFERVNGASPAPVAASAAPTELVAASAPERRGEPAPLVRTEKSGVCVLHSDRSATGGFAEHDAGTYADLIEKHRKEFDYVVVDTPALMTNAEAAIIAGAADFAFVVAEWCATTREAARVGAQRLLDARGRILSFVITKVDEKQRIYFRPEDRHFFFRNA